MAAKFERHENVTFIFRIIKDLEGLMKGDRCLTLFPKQKCLRMFHGQGHLQCGIKEYPWRRYIV